MTEAYLVTGISLLIIVLFYSGKVSVDTAALFGLSIFLVAGFITPKEAFEGFSSDAVILMISSFFLSAAFKLTGVGDRFGRGMQKFAGQSETRAILITMLLTAAVSSVINNTAAVAIMLPAAASLAKRANVAPYKLFLPLSFSALLGGTLTLIGTSSNLLAAEALQKAGYASFEMLEFLPLGLTLVIVGVLYFLFVGRFLLNIGRGEKSTKDRQSLSSVYQLNERIFQIQLSNSTPLQGCSLKQLDFNHHIGMEVLSIERAGTRIEHLTPESVLQNSDKLLVRGRSGDLKRILRLSSGGVIAASSLLSEQELDGFCCVEFEVTQSLLAQGQTLASLEFRHNTGMHIALIQRETEISGDELPHTILRLKDKLIAYGPKAKLPKLSKVGLAQKDYKVIPIGSQSRELLFGFKLPEDIELSNVKVRDLGMQEVLGVTVIAIKRDGILHQSISGNDPVKPNDFLIVVGESSALKVLNGLAGSIVTDSNISVELESDDLSLQEVVLAPRSKLIGKTLAEVQFAARYGLKVISLWRDGEPKRTRFARYPLKFGDTLLLRGTRDKFELLNRDSDFVVLTTEYTDAIRPQKAVWALFALFLLVLLSTFQIFAPSVVALVVCVSLVLSGALRLEEAYREIDWRLIVIVGALLPFQIILPRYGITQEIAQFIGGIVNQHEIFFAAAVLILFSSILTQLLDSTIAVVALSPVAISLAESQGISVQPLVMAVAVGASFGFLTPLGHRAHLLIVAPGGYKTIDFIRVGSFLTIITIAITAAFCAFGTG